MVQTATAAAAAPENPTAIFDTAIADAERLLELFDKLSKPEQQANKVLKRTALEMLTAWVTSRVSWLGRQANQKIDSNNPLFVVVSIKEHITKNIMHNNHFSDAKSQNIGNDF